MRCVKNTDEVVLQYIILTHSQTHYTLCIVVYYTMQVDISYYTFSFTCFISQSALKATKIILHFLHYLFVVFCLF